MTRSKNTQGPEKINKIQMHLEIKEKKNRTPMSAAVVGMNCKLFM
jgi:hypothetical protein